MSDLTRLERRLHCYQVVLWLKKSFRLSSNGDTAEDRGRGQSHQQHARTKFDELPEASPPRHGTNNDELDPVSLPKAVVYKAYLNMCRAQGLKPHLKPPGLGKMVHNAFPGLMTKRRGPRGRVVQFYVGLQQAALQTQQEPWHRPGCNEVYAQAADHGKQLEHANASEEDCQNAGWSGSGEWSQISWHPDKGFAPQAELPHRPCDVLVQNSELWPNFSTPIEPCEELAAAHCESSRSSFFSSYRQSPLSSPQRTEKWRLSGEGHQFHQRFDQLDSTPLGTAPTIKTEPVDAQQEEPQLPFVEQDVSDASYLIEEAMPSQLGLQDDGSPPEGGTYVPSTEVWARLVICPESASRSAISLIQREDGHYPVARRIGSRSITSRSVAAYSREGFRLQPEL